MSSSEPYQCVTHDHMKMVAKHLIHCLPVLSFLVFSFFFLFFFSFITNNISSSEPCQCATHDYMKMVAQHLIHCFSFSSFFLKWFVVISSSFYWNPVCDTWLYEDGGTAFDSWPPICFYGTPSLGTWDHTYVQHKIISVLFLCTMFITNV